MKKKIIVSLVIMAILSAQRIYAQRPPSGKIDHLKTELNLSDQQTAQLEKIFEAKHAEMKALKSDESKSPEEKQEAIRNSRKATEKEIEGVLNADQLAKFKEIKKEHKGKHGMKGEGYGHHDHFKDGKGKAFHEKLKAYQEENIKPVMLVQRAKLEPKISAEDKQTIAELRAGFEKMKTERQARHEAMEKNRADGKTQDVRKKQKEGKGGKDQSHHEKLKTLVDKYKADIQPLFEEVADQQEKWEKDIKAIAENTFDVKEEDLDHHKEMIKENYGNQITMMKMSRFLLLDPNEKAATANNANQVANITAFPNPASSVTTIEYEVLAAGEVLIELRDNKGKLLKTVKNAYHEKGTHQVTISLEAYQSDLFYVVIQDKNGLSATKNIVRAR